MSSMLSRLRSRVSSAYPTATADASPPSDVADGASDDGAQALARLRAAVSDLPDSDDFITDDCLRRYLRARGDDVPKASRMLRGTLEWRTSYGPSRLADTQPDSLRFEASSGKMYVLPQADAQQRAVIVMRPGLENSRDPKANVANLVYTLERAATLAASAGGEQFVVIVDYSVGSVSVSTMPSLSVMRETTHILQNHYPERLSKMVMVQAPRLFHSMFKLIRPLVDSATRDKIHFVSAQPDVATLPSMDPAALPVEYGGSLSHVFDVDNYFSK